ncbi:cardiotrophin-1-like isoform X2 [Stegostoma tigrinum]|uniref:cardiotrophin-1-like isoform X2 n=1 Tax=Stegostoma tigrinum TaxID=3053191 RepID=UPI0028706A10|nr:cardiotrophin-1-like isoform X2 [Stegostoma tigrinum]
MIRLIQRDQQLTTHQTGCSNTHTDFLPMSNMDSVNETLERSYNLSVWLAHEASSLLELYIDMQGFRDGPPRIPDDHLQLPMPPSPDDEDWEPTRRLCQHRTACRLLATLLDRVLGEQRELNETRHHLHQQLQLAITGLQGLDANLSHVLSSLGSGEEEGDGQSHVLSGPSSDTAHWEAKVNGYHIIAHYTHWVARTVEDLERLKDHLKPEA